VITINTGRIGRNTATKNSERKTRNFSSAMVATRGMETIARRIF